jgi:hypothetical protein
MSKTTKTAAAAKPAAAKPTAKKAASSATPAKAAAAAPVSAPVSESAAPAEAPVAAPTPPAASVAPEAPVVTSAALAPAPVKTRKTDAQITADENAEFKGKVTDSFTALVKAKTTAGLPRKDAVEVSRRQLEYDFGGAPAEIKALLKEALDAAVAASAPAAK